MCKARKTLAKPTRPRVQWAKAKSRRGGVSSVRSSRQIWRGLALASAALLGSAIPGQAQTGEPASLAIIFDGSGSMWGNIEGARASKFVMARDALKRALPKVAPQTRVGLASFGHRRGDCTDVEMIKPPEPRRCRAPARVAGAAQPARARAVDAGAARGRQGASAAARQAQPAAHSRRCRQLPAEYLHRRPGAARYRHHRPRRRPRPEAR